MTPPPEPIGARIGVLLVNLGTPDAPEPGAVRRYLAEFLSDRRVVEIPPLLWQPILRGAVLTTRPAKSARAYRLIWSDAGSPLAAITRAQTDALQADLGRAARVTYAMRYGDPAIGPAIDALIAAGCDRILVVPLYPQYCGATTATAVDAVGAHLATLRAQPSLRFLPPYPDDPAYIGALKASVEAGLAALDFAPDVLLASFHGMPERTRALGDPYHDQCQTTARLLSDALGRPVEVAFQSRFGRARWLEPATEATLVRLGGEGRSIAVFAPGFAADCLETLEELAIRGKQAFERAGGRDFAYLPCLNADAAGLEMLTALVRRELAGWLPG
ncbi:MULTISPECIES: ferrochelatase [Sphingopyxis]|uniref:ferrochelatase n=1 Tax=Sphingopyxis TaxID=165697 RepID=UPI00095841BB|nr:MULTISPECIES: ferrochelatase [Sphingopyxis]APW73686.1 ferrochelatase [Sphingopyxis granuli]AVA14838.1 ferrochelatase [Sphingopyxis sp. MG]